MQDLQEELVGGLIEDLGLVPASGAGNQRLIQAGMKKLRGFSVTTRLFAGSTTYTPSLRLIAALVEVQAGGGGGGACPGASSGLGGAGGGGGGGGFISAWFSQAAIGASQSLTVGVSGYAGLVGAAPTAAGACGFGGYLTAFGGAGGYNSPANGTAGAGGGGGYSSSAGTVVLRSKAGRHGATGYQSAVNGASGIGGIGGDAEMGFGGAQGFATDAPGGRAPDGQDYGGGGSGAGVNTTTVNGGNGAPAIVRITEITWNT